MLVLMLALSVFSLLILVPLGSALSEVCKHCGAAFEDQNIIKERSIRCGKFLLHFHTFRCSQCGKISIVKYIGIEGAPGIIYWFPWKG